MGLLFWPFMIASIVLSFISLVMKKPMFLVISSLLIIPLSLYLAASPRFEWWGLIFPFFYLGAALSLRKNIRWLSALLIAPNIILIGWIGYAVINQ
ncbi:hypothetical protein [Ureibacillus chungkukjangi]|uniref:Uncharacterized protein n=1 Tax=Ureibacillus chungkukjangi TaxID=1202712 RepID=A0A318TLU8_9BACL|nr:hypothetical protein [Ureibacillus chungkukjangi]MCM3387799.1 hypothetical protein [Ureibacillus chungkukjangi]PYF05726.1 hypothetical protein BJ095_11675 [Ureibacillus chungkukjangi]